MTPQPWIKFYPRDWRGDQALRLVSLQARGLWIDMLCVMHTASPYGHLMNGDQPLSDADLARLAGSTVEEVQALLVELLSARVARQTRAGVIYSKRMTADHKRSKDGRKAKLEALEKEKENPRPSRLPPSTPPTQKAEARAKTKGPSSPLVLSEGRDRNLDLKEDRDTEREWSIDKQRAEDDLILAKRQDPDRASELEEFIQVAKDRLAELRRARLSVVAA